MQNGALIAGPPVEKGRGYSQAPMVTPRLSFRLGRSYGDQQKNSIWIKINQYEKSTKNLLVEKVLLAVCSKMSRLSRDGVFDRHNGNSAFGELHHKYFESRVNLVNGIIFGLIVKIQPPYQVRAGLFRRLAIGVTTEISS